MPPELLPLPIPTSENRRSAVPPGVRKVPARRRTGDLRQTFWWITGFLFSLVLVEGSNQPVAASAGALLIIAAALLPSFLWITRRVVGLPIFPLYALTAIWIYALPLVSDHPIVILFPPAFQLFAALSITGFLLLGTGAWYLVARRRIREATSCWMFNESQSDPLLVAGLGISTLVMLATSSGWVILPAGVFSVVRAVLLASLALICFVLSYRLSQRKLTPIIRTLFYVLVASIVVIQTSSLLLINAMSLLSLSVLAYVIGCRRFPWIVCLSTLVVFSYLHYGKGPMREKYWREDDTFEISPFQYPSFYADWIKTAWGVITHPDPDDQPESLTQRASLMHLLLYVQSMTPGSLPFLHGESYKAVPIQFVPRVFDPDKPRSHEGTYILCIYYNLQTREDTEVTTIDFGLINEAYANFGLAGMAVLAVVLGSAFGMTANWARHMPILSFRSLFATLILGSVLQASSSASFYLATIYQDAIVLVFLCALFMRFKRPNRLQNSLLE